MMKRNGTTWLHTLAAILALGLMAPACGDDGEANGNGDHDHDHDHGDNPEEVITTVTLTFTPDGGGNPVEATYRDLNPDDAEPPELFEEIVLDSGNTYTLTLTLLNETDAPPENVTDEISEEDDEHQFFFQGPAVGSLVTVDYADMDENGLPVGLVNNVQATTAGTEPEGFRVILKHQPPEGGVPVKTMNSGINDGGTDVDLAFDITVN